MTFSPVAFSGTVATWPPTPPAFHSAINRWLSCLRRAGLVHYFWVMEFQRRGHPHFHAALFFPTAPVLARIRNLWLNAAADFGASFSAHLCPEEILFGRNARPCIRHIKGMKEWTGYMGKTFLHAMRSYDHSQRSYNVADAPLEWNASTGRFGVRIVRSLLALQQNTTLIFSRPMFLSCSLDLLDVGDFPK